MFRKLAIGLAILLCWVPTQVLALGLGNIEMRSALNQPLDAQIELLRARPGELKDLVISLASADTFKRAGMDRPAFLSQLRFEVVSNPSGVPYIQVKSAQPITEPFLNFLIEVNWPNGRLLREFTVLVDPPVLAERAPGGVETPVAQSPEGLLVDQLAAEALGKVPPSASGAIEIPVPGQRASTPVTVPVPPAQEEVVTAVEPTREAPVEAPPVERATRAERPKPAPRKAPEPEASEQVAEGGSESTPVKPNDTLWEIALKMRPNKSVSVPQMMIALLQNNPEAFYGNNINNLKQGSVLRLSDVSVATSLNKEEAERIADLQWDQWKESRGASVGSTASRTGRVPRTSEPTDARVKLVSPDVSGLDAAGSSSAPKAAAAGGARDPARLKQELTIAQESLDGQRRETQDMRERVTALEEQVSTMQRLVQLKDDQLASMQNQGSKGKNADEAAGGGATKTKDSSSPRLLGLVTGLMNDPKLIGLVVVVGGIVVLLVWLFVRRRRMQQFEESILTLNDSVTDSAMSMSKPESENASFMSDFSVSSMEGIQTEINEVDPLSEADVYLAYGRFKQAEDLVSQAIEKNPQRAELKMKLMDIHYAAKDAEAFSLQAELVQKNFSAQHPGMWARVLEMGRELAPDKPLFGGAGGGKAAAAVSDAVDEFDLGDLNFGEATEPAPSKATAKVPAKGTRASESQVLDFDLSEFDEIKHVANKPGRAATTTSTSAAKDASENALDFDFSSFGKSPEVSTEAAEVEAATDDAGLDFDFGSSPSAPASTQKAAVKREDNVVDFSYSATSNSAESELMDQPNNDVALAEAGIDGELDDALFADVDEIGTKLDLAKAYIDMGDSEGARSILDEVMEEGNDHQKQEAQVLIRQMG